MIDSISSKEKCFETGLISRDEYVGWLKENHPNLTMGDWQRVCEHDNLRAELIKMEENYDAKIEELEFDNAKMKAEVESADNHSEDLADKLKVKVKKEKSINEVTIGDWVIMHTSINYSPAVTIVESHLFHTYFNEDNGWDEESIAMASGLEPGDCISCDMGNAIHVVRV